MLPVAPLAPSGPSGPFDPVAPVSPGEGTSTLSIDSEYHPTRSRTGLRPRKHVSMNLIAFNITFCGINYHYLSYQLYFYWW